MRGSRGHRAPCLLRDAGFDAELLAGVENGVPDTLGMFGREIDLEAVFAGVSGASDAGRDIRDLIVEESVIRKQMDRKSSQPLERILGTRTLNGKLRVAVAHQ